MVEFNYRKYFASIKPKRKMDVYNRFIFAFCSVHTTWERNIIGYDMLKNTYHSDEVATKDLIRKAGLGLTNNRARFITTFTEDFNGNYKQFLKQSSETWNGYATRLQKRILGLGHAKTRFAIELIYPNTADIACVDTHIIQWAKQNPNKMNKTLYDKIETGWKNHAAKHGMKPVEARWRFWDKKQGYTDPRYWSKVLEDE